MIFDPLPHQFDIFLCSMDPRFGVTKLDALNYCYYYQNAQSVVGTLKLLRVDLQCYRLLQAMETRCNLRTWNWQRILGSKIRPEDVMTFSDAKKEWANVRAIHNATLIFHRRKRKLDALLKRHMRRWYKRVVLPRKKIGQIVAHKDGKEDRIFDVYYDEKKHPFWVAAFSNLFGGKDEEGRVIMNVNEIGTSQDAIGAFCDFMRNGNSKVINNVFYDAAREGCGSEMLDQMVIIGRLWDNPEFADKADSMLSDYINDTLNREKINKDKRLTLFVEKDFLMAKAAWEGIFDTSKKRLKLASQLEMPDRRHNAFRKCETVEQLIAYLGMIRGRKKNLTSSSSF